MEEIFTFLILGNVFAIAIVTIKLTAKIFRLKAIDEALKF